MIGTEKATYLISRCKIYEKLYIHGASPGEAPNNLQSALVALYAEILRFLATANRLYNKNTASRALHASLSPDEVRDFVQNCLSLEQRVDIEASSCEHIYSREVHTKSSEDTTRLEQLLKDMREPIARVDDGVRVLWDTSLQSEQSNILCRVSSTPYEENHKIAREGRTENTGQWLLMNEKYCE